MEVNVNNMLCTTHVIEEIGAAVRMRECTNQFTDFDGNHSIQGLNASEVKAWWLKFNWLNCYAGICDELDIPNLVWGNNKIYFAPALDKTMPTSDMGLCAVHIMKICRIPDDACFSGELTGAGEFLPLTNPISVGRLAAAEGKTLYCPAASAYMCKLGGAKVVAVATLKDLYKALLLHEKAKFNKPDVIYDMSLRDTVDMKYIKGQAIPKFALEVAVAGQHNILFGGSQGTGKSLLAKAVPSIAPPMTQEETVEVSALWQAANKTTGLVPDRPVRFVDPSITKQALIGGGTEAPVIGEVTLAHRGVLFLDEFLQFSPSVLESLRAPIQDGVVTLSRVQWKAEFPCSFQLIAAMNLCRCGYHLHPTIPCTCTKSARNNYQAKLSGPLVDRIPIRIHVQPLTPAELFSTEEEEGSASVRERIVWAREVQQDRYKCSNINYNDELGPEHIHNISIDNNASSVLQSYAVDKSLSARATMGLLKVSRTVADLMYEDSITVEAMQKTIECLGEFNIRGDE